MTNPPDSDQFDALILGAGQAGKPLALALAEKGWKTAIIERSYVGGTCINYGCTPTKTMLASAEMAYQARRASDYGIDVGEVQVNFKAVIDRKNAIVEEFRQKIEETFSETAHLTLIKGDAQFTGLKQVQVTQPNGSTRILTADKIFIDCGTRPSQPEMAGIESVNWLTSTSLMDIDTLPEHLLIIGGGYISVEFSQMFRRFGSRVTLISRDAQLMADEDTDIATEIARFLTKEGIELHLKTAVEHISRRNDGTIDIQLRTDGKTISVSGSHLLVAIGQTPNADSLNLGATNVDIDKHGFIQVNEQLETTQPGIYAMGDIKGGPAFTHISYDDYRILKQNILEGGNATTTGRLVPYTLFTDPQLGRIGLTEQQARQQGKAIQIASMPMRSIGRAIETGHTEGLMKVVLDAHTKQVLGAAMLGMDGGELMSMLQIAMMGKLPYPRLRDAIFAHPTLAESLNNLFANVGD